MVLQIIITIIITAAATTTTAAIAVECVINATAAIIYNALY